MPKNCFTKCAPILAVTVLILSDVVVMQVFLNGPDELDFGAYFYIIIY
jgi:hypothetical protein